VHATYGGTVSLPLSEQSSSCILLLQIHWCNRRGLHQGHLSHTCACLKHSGPHQRSHISGARYAGLVVFSTASSCDARSVDEATLRAPAVQLPKSHSLQRPSDAKSKFSSFKSRLFEKRKKKKKKKKKKRAAKQGRWQR